MLRYTFAGIPFSIQMSSYPDIYGFSLVSGVLKAPGVRSDFLFSIIRNGG